MDEYRDLEGISALVTGSDFGHRQGSAMKAREIMASVADSTHSVGRAGPWYAARITRVLLALPVRPKLQRGR
jgi:hypothetical protein